MPYQLITPPASEPVLVEDVKLNSRIDSDADDALIAELITSARTHAENYMDRSILPQTWRLVLDSFPGLCSVGSQLVQRPYSLPDNAILFGKTPVTGVTSIKYLDMSATLQTWDPSQYTVEASGDLCRITPIFGQIYPITLPQIGAVQVNFTAGWPTVAAVPMPIIRAIKMLAGYWYNTREAVTGQNLRVVPHGIEALLGMYQNQVN